MLEVIVHIKEALKKQINFIVTKPILATLFLKLRPAWSFKENNANDIAFQLGIQLVLMGIDLVDLTVLSNSDDPLSNLFNTFNFIATSITEVHFSNELTEEEKEQLIATKTAQEKELKKLKKLIHAFARLLEYDLEEEENFKIINLEKVLARYRKNLIEMDELNKPDYEKSLPEIQNQTAIKFQLSQDLCILQKFHYINKNDTSLINEADKINPSAPFIRQKYAVTTLPIDPISDDNQRAQRKKVKSRLNKFSFAVSLIVGLGEGLIGTVFMLGSFSFLPALLLVGIPAALCNYFLFRNDSFSVMKEICFGKSNDSKRIKNMKNISTIFSAGAGIAYGFLSFSSATVGFGHLIFGLTATAAIATPPFALIIIASVIAIVTAIAITTLYDYMIRKWINDDMGEKIKQTKENVINFFKKPCSEYDHWSELKLSKKCQCIAKKTVKLLFLTVMLAGCITISVVTLGLFSHKAFIIFHKSFDLASSISNKLSLALIAVAAATNSLFYSRGVVRALNLVKKVVTSPAKIIHSTVNLVKNFYKQNMHQRVATVFSAVKRGILLACVFSNSCLGQGCGMGKSKTAQDIVKNDLLQGEFSTSAIRVVISTVGTMGSGIPNAIAIKNVTETVTSVKHSTPEIATVKSCLSESESETNSALRSAGFFSQRSTNSTHSLQSCKSETSIFNNANKKRANIVPFDHNFQRSNSASRTQDNSLSTILV